MYLPVEQLVIGLFALFGAAVTGVFSVYNTKISKKLSKVEKKSDNSDIIFAENNLLEKIVPALERKDEALDKIAEILEDILRVQELQATHMKALTLITGQRCEALNLLKAIKSFEDAKVRQAKIDKLRDDNALEAISVSLDEIVKLFENGYNNNSETEKEVNKDDTCLLE